MNQMNDWEETDAPVGERYKVRGGWLLDTEDAQGARGNFLASPVACTHLGFLLGHLILRDWNPPAEPVPEWMLNPSEQRTKTLHIANAIHAFADAHPNTQVVPVYLPADLYASEGRADKSPLTQHLSALGLNPWEDDRLRNQTMTALSEHEPIDLSDALVDQTSFLEGDYHLSAMGHQAVANTIMDTIANRARPAEASPTEPEKPPQ